MDYVIIVNWFYSVKNWFYVVLSKVRTLSGLFLFKPLDFNKYYREDIKLKMHMKELQEKEKKLWLQLKKFPRHHARWSKDPHVKVLQSATVSYQNQNMKILMITK